MKFVQTENNLQYTKKDTEMQMPYNNTAHIQIYRDKFDSYTTEDTNIQMSVTITNNVRKRITLTKLFR